ncbi:hypothetical protein SKAU_G00397000 [Synaphobranchus kaupii]|uniref:Gypsy retrotransposon integrase-like protein 1 n=1 Tax=Synaphobranchus kaupii TaxID=118154 RepID=A0A9Q1E8A3_SYNKA|nr:hypothetical protein SKAU_G00397000 [Synaphobranchus kaupii]
MPKFCEEDADTFFEAFEIVAREMEWPDAKWALLVQSSLAGKAQVAFAALDPCVGLDYEELKKAVLAAYGGVPESYHQRFRNLKRRNGESYLDVGRRLSIAFDRWLAAGKVFDYSELREFMLVEQFKNSVPREVEVYLSERQTRVWKSSPAISEEVVVCPDSVTPPAVVPEPGAPPVDLEESVELADTVFARAVGTSEPSHFTREALVREQHQDGTLAALWKEAVTEEESQDVAAGVYVQDDVLMRKWQPVDRPANEDWWVRSQVVVPLQFWEEVMQLSHATPMAGHLGVRKTLERILRHFYWPQVKGDVLQYVATFKARLGAAWQVACNNLAGAKERIKSQFDRKAVSRSFAVGDRVLMLLPVGVVLPGSEDEDENLYTPPEPVSARVENTHALEQLGKQLSHLTAVQRQDVLELVASHPVLFKDRPGLTPLAIHDVETASAEAIKQHPYRFPPHKKKQVAEEVAYMLEIGAIEPGRTLQPIAGERSL